MNHRRTIRSSRISALASESVFCDPLGQEVDNRAGVVCGGLQVPAPVEVGDHLAVGLMSQPEFADPAGAEFVLFGLGVVFEDQDLKGVAGDRSADPGARGVQLAAFGVGDLQAVAQVVVRVQLCVLCVGETNRSTTTQLPHHRQRHPADSQRFRINCNSFCGVVS